MPHNYLHNHKDFSELIRIVANTLKIAPVLVEKDYWIMHSLYGLQQLNMKFELKGGTSLSKGFHLINRFSEDIDIRIEPPETLGVSTGKNQNKDTHIQSRKNFYDWLTQTIQIDGIILIERDTAFDDVKFRSGGIRLIYTKKTTDESDLKDGILLEVGFDDVTPNIPKDISSWAYDYASSKRVKIIDNRALHVLCYDPSYTLVEKLQTISTKYRQQQNEEKFPANFLRHYYDVYCLLGDKDVQNFIGTHEYQTHKIKRFCSENQNIIENEAFILSNPQVFKTYETAYEKTKSLYYQSRPTFYEIINRIKQFAGKL